MLPRPSILLAGATAAFAPCLALAQCTTVPFVESTRVTVPSAGAEFLVSGDVNGDGIPDLLMKSAPFWIQVALGDGTGHFTFGDKIDVDEAESAALADFNGDGILDLVTGGPNSVKLFKGMGAGHFALKRITNLVGDVLGTPNSGAPIRTATSLVVADFNGDGKLDIAFPLFSAANIRIQYSDATGLEVASQLTLDHSGPLPAAITPKHLLALDFDNDGEWDFAITDSGGSSVELVNQYDHNPAGFTDRATIAAGPAPFSLAKGDFNEDGFTDLAVRNNAGEIRLLKGGGHTNFFNLPTLDTWQTIKPPISPNYLEVADFNNDGHDDLLVTGSSLQLLLGDGTGIFTTSTIAQLGGSPTAVSVNDFDRDGRLDFAVVNKADNYVAVFLNKCTGPPADLAIAAVEVTQTIQDFGNTVPLIAGKRTFVRVHVSGNVQAKEISAKLTATNANVTALSPMLLPQNPSGVIDVKKNPNRGLIDDSFWFELPPEWLYMPSLVLKAEVNTNQALSEGDYTNDVMTQPVAFTTGKKLKVRFVRYSLSDITVTDESFDKSFGEGLQSLLTELPVASIDATRTEFTDSEPLGAQGVIAAVARLCAWHDIAEPNLPGVFYYGIGNFGGSIGLIGAPNDHNWFGAGNVGPIAHEFGHMLSLLHVSSGGDCAEGDGPDLTYPYPNGTIGGPAFQRDRFFGLNPVNPQPAFANLFKVVPNTTADRMTYCARQWFSDWSTRKIQTYIQQNPNIALVGRPVMLAAAPQPRGIFSLASVVREGYEYAALPPTDPYQVGDFLTVYGTLDLSQQKVTSLRLSREPAVGTIAVSQPGPYRVRLMDAAGQTLAVHAFSPARLADSQNGGLIALTLPYASGTSKIVIETGTPSRALSSTNVSNTAPTVSAVTISSGTSSSKQRTITWKGADADGDALRYAILYSADGKQTWRPIAQGIRVTRFVADSMAFEGPRGNSAGYIRVVAHDGVLTGRAESGAFKVENKSPRIVLISPQRDATYEMNQFVTLQALGDDPEDGALADGALAWKSDRDGALGTGRLVQARNLSKGDHIISVSATDSEGKTAIERAVIHVGNRAPPLVVKCTRGSGNAMTLGGYSTNRAPFTIRAAAVKGMIGKGRAIYSSDAAGNLARIKVVRRGGRDYLRTVVTGRRTENLLQLPTCR